MWLATGYLHYGPAAPDPGRDDRGSGWVGLRRAFGRDGMRWFGCVEGVDQRGENSPISGRRFPVLCFRAWLARL
jgi:hypothetical protein